MLKLKLVGENQVSLKRYYTSTDFKLGRNIIIVHKEKSSFLSDKSWDEFQEVERPITTQNVFDIYEISGSDTFMLAGLQLSPEDKNSVRKIGK